jgi:hypothetical protein
LEENPPTSSPKTLTLIWPFNNQHSVSSSMLDSAALQVQEHLSIPHYMTNMSKESLKLQGKLRLVIL